MLQEQLEADLITALKAHEDLKVSTLRLLKTAVKNMAIEKKTDKIEDADVIRVIQKQAKQRQDSIKSFADAGREEMAAKEQAELDILESYLPAPLSDDELTRAVDTAIEETGASVKADMGKVMKAVMLATGGRADGKKVSAAVSQKLK